MTTCMRCGAEIPDGVFICPGCGLDVQLVPNYENLDLDMMLRQNDSEDKKIEQLEERREIRRQQNRKITIIKRICGIAIAAVAAIGVLASVMTIRSTMIKNVEDYNTAYDDALQMFEAGEYQDAYNAINTALEYDDDSVEAMILKARIAYFGLENMDEALSILRNIIAADENDSAAYGALLEIYADAGEYDNIADLMEGAAPQIISDYQDYIVSSPTVSPDGGTFNEDQAVVISAGEGCEIYYTTDPSAEFDAYTLYTEPVSITGGNTSLKVVAVNANGIHSRTVTKSFSVIYDVPDAPVILTSSGSYVGNNNTVTIQTMEGCTIYYSVDGKPSTLSSIYTEPFEMAEGRHFVYAIAVNERGIQSTVAGICYEYAQEVEVPDTGYNRPSSVGNSSSNNNSNSRPDYSTPTIEATPEPTPEATPTPEDTPEPTPETTPTPEVTPEPTPEITPEPDQPDGNENGGSDSAGGSDNSGSDQNSGSSDQAGSSDSSVSVESDGESAQN